MAEEEARASARRFIRLGPSDANNESGHLAQGSCGELWLPLRRAPRAFQETGQVIQLAICLSLRARVREWTWQGQ